jgi:gliding motility-associated-like protein
VAIIASANITDATCSSGTQDGAIDITVSGGSGVFTYGWSNGTTTEDVNGVVAGFYSVVISDENGCSSGEFEFEIEAETYVSAYAGNNQLVCPGLKFNLSGSAGDSVEWWPDVFVTHPNSTFTEASIPATTVFTYTVYDLASGCEASDTVKMIADVVPEIDIFNSFTGEPLDSVIYLAQGDSAIMYASIGFQNYLWSPDMYIDNANSIQVIIRPPEDISYRVYGYTVTGCRDSAFVHVILRRPVKIYTGFSPNGDEYNPVWVIENAEQWGDKIHVRIFNRWGELIFESKGYGGDAAWDGTRNGKLMPVGSYYYIIDIKDGMSKPYTGTVTINIKLRDTG